MGPALRCRIKTHVICLVSGVSGRFCRVNDVAERCSVLRQGCGFTAAGYSGTTIVRVHHFVYIDDGKIQEIQR